MLAVGKFQARIKDYGVQLSKQGKPFITIDFLVEGQEERFALFPYNKEGGVNAICVEQLAECGFDPDKYELDDLAKGVASGILITDQDIPVTVGPRTMGDGSQSAQITNIGHGKPSLSQEAASEVLASLKGQLKGIKLNRKVREKTKTLEDMDKIF